MSDTLPDHYDLTLDAGLREDKFSSQAVYQGGMLQVYRDDVRLPDGKSAWREYVVHPGAVVIVPLLPGGRLLFERQFRYPLNRVFLEFPAGKIDPGEAMLKTAQRELQEETGYVAERWTELGVMHPCIGYSNEQIGIFLAEDLRSTQTQALDEGEFVDLLSLSFEEVEEGIRRGDITDAKTITALHFALLHQQKSV